VTEPASVLALRQLAAEARERRTAVRRSARPLRPPAQPHPDGGQHEAEEQLGDTDPGAAAGEPGR
jgi:hypothetical protein